MYPYPEKQILKTAIPGEVVEMLHCLPSKGEALSSKKENMV
jgi:hypothetical protein